jgi:hypothetical protein
MEYFTDEVLSFDPFATEEAQKAQDMKWEKAVQSYKVRIKEIENRLLKSAYKFYTTQSFHDYDLVSFQTREQKKKPLPLEIHMEIKKGDRFLFLTYTDVQNFQLTYKTETSYRGLGCFVHDELLDINENFLSHEIMLSTGSSIKITFKNKCLKISKR